MCTVSYVPDHSGGFVLISSRDEKPGRKTMRPENDHGMLYPKDAVAGGTWISVDESGRVGCLLNGAFEKHESQTNTFYSYPRWNPPRRACTQTWLLRSV